jgi:Tfp pilus assembly protein PilF
MAEEAAVESGESSSGGEMAAAALALAGASRAEADAYLRDQRHHMHEQLKQLSLSLWEKRISVFLRLATACVGMAFAAGIALMVWDAVHADGLVIESFSVPADMAEHGLTGQVVATQMLDKLATMQTFTASNRAPRTYANNWGDDLKVEIPETGISVSEAYSFLRGWLGHETHVSGEVFRTTTGIAVTARIGAESGATFTGAEGDLDALEQKAAEHIYGSSQPYRYGIYLNGQNRISESDAVFEKMARTGAASERAWAYNGLGINDGSSNSDLALGKNLYGQGVALDPGNAILTSNLANQERSLGQAEQALADYRKSVALLSSTGQGKVRDDYVPTFRHAQQGQVDALLGDYSAAARETGFFVQSGVIAAPALSSTVARNQADGHDIAAARATMANPAADPPGRALEVARVNRETQIEIVFMAGDWPDVLRQDAAMQQFFLANPGQNTANHLISGPQVALAEARLGRIADAEALVADMPDDCNRCLIARAQIADIKGDHARADALFALAVASAPSIPKANTAWGFALLDRGQPDAAMEKFKLSNRQGPHFADPLEGWAEALMAKNQSHLALAKFEEANKYAPNWGRLHLKWGEALAYAGKKDDAAKEFAKAATLDLTAAEKSELTRVQ